MGQALRGGVAGGGGWRRALARCLTTLAVALALAPRATFAQPRPPVPAGADLVRGGRFDIVAFAPDLQLARSLLAAAATRDSFPGLPRPTERVLVQLAPDMAHFREWIGRGAPEWGVAFAIPAERRIVMHGRRASSEVGDPRDVLRHELAHLALHEYMGDLPPRWFDEGYAGLAAGEWGREEVLAASVALAVRGVPPLDTLEEGFYGGTTNAVASYALAFRAVSELASLDPERGLSLLFRYWRETRSLDQGVRLAYGVTLGAFEARWQRNTRRRYGTLAVVTDLTIATAIVSVILLPLYISRRRRDRRRLAALVAADVAAERAAEREAERSALDAILQAAPPAASEPSSAASDTSGRASEDAQPPRDDDGRSVSST